jgi:hypothetical protein
MHYCYYLLIHACCESIQLAVIMTSSSYWFTTVMLAESIQLAVIIIYYLL